MTDVQSAQAALNLAKESELLTDRELADFARLYGDEWTGQLREVQDAQRDVTDALRDQEDAARRVADARQRVLDIERQIADRIRGEAESQGVRDARIRLADVEHHFAN